MALQMLGGVVKKKWLPGYKFKRIRNHAAPCGSVGLVEPGLLRQLKQYLFALLCNNLNETKGP